MSLLTNHHHLLSFDKDLETRFLALEARLEALEEKNAAGWAKLFGGKVR